MKLSSSSREEGYLFNRYWTGILRYINRGLTERRVTSQEAWDVHGVFVLLDKQANPHRNYLSSIGGK